MTDIKKKVTESVGERRHELRRTEDISNPRERRRSILSGLIARHPVMIAFAVALIVALVPVLMLINQQGTLRRQQDTIGNLLTQVSLSRRATTVRFCDAINRNALASNRTTDVITGFVINSTRSSKAFERVYRQLGLPPYKVRLAQARKLSDNLVKQKLPVIDCQRIARQIDRQLAAASHAIPPAARLSKYPH
jgi:hypothetical protein